MTRGIKRDGSVERLCLPVAEWPALDISLWEQSMTSTQGLFGDKGARAGLRPTTNRNVAKGYGRWLQVLQDWGELDAHLAPGDRITKERVRRYVKNLTVQGNSAASIAARLEQMKAAALVIAPDMDWDWLKRAASRLRARSVPIHEKRARMESADELLALGHQLMQDAPQRPKPGQRAVLYRDGLMIAFLALQPLRLKNLAGLEIGRTVQKVDGLWMITLPGDETKTHVPIEDVWPASLVEALEHYLAHVRPVLIQRRRTSTTPAGNHLWVSAEGRPLSQKRIHHAIELRTQERLGKAINPHLFRDIAATTLGIEAPRHVRAAAAVLGHSQLNTTERHYQQATGLQAQRNYSDEVSRLRAAAGDCILRKKSTSG